MGEEEDLLADEVLQDKRETYQVAVAGVVLPDMAAELRPLTGSLPGMVRNLLEGYDRRTIGLEEREAMAARILRDRLSEAERTLVSLQEDRDRAELIGGDTATVEERIRESRETLRRLRATNPASMSIAAFKPISYLENEFETFRSLRFPQSLLREYDADLVLYVTVEPLDTYMMVRIMSVDRALEHVTEIVRFAALPDEVAVSLEDVASEVQEYVIGAPFASLSVTLTGSDNGSGGGAEIYVDGRFQGYGAVQVDTLMPGTHLVLVRTSWGGVYRTSAMVETGESKEVEIALPETASGSIRVTSNPSGANVYRGVEWIGTTPLSVERPDRMVQYALRRSGYWQSQFVAGPSVDTEIEKALVPEGYDWEGRFTESRNRFYRSFGFFLGSVAIPVALNGLYQDVAIFLTGSSVTDLSTGDQYRSYVDMANAIYYGYYTSLAVSGVFFTNMVRRLTQYIRLGQEFHER